MGYIMKKNFLSNPRVQNTLGAFIDYPSLLLTPRSVVGVPNGPLKVKFFKVERSICSVFKF